MLLSNVLKTPLTRNLIKLIRICFIRFKEIISIYDIYDSLRKEGLSDDDYIEMYLNADVSSGSPSVQGGTGTGNSTYFGAYRLIT